MYKYYEYGTLEYYDQELTKASNSLCMAAKGFASLVKDDTPIGKIDEYAETLHNAALHYETAFEDWDKYVSREDNNK